MTIDKYEMEFDRLFKYATKFVKNDLNRANLFEQGLYSHIWRGLAILYLTSYAEVVGHSKSLESI